MEYFTTASLRLCTLQSVTPHSALIDWSFTCNIATQLGIWQARYSVADLDWGGCWPLDKHLLSVHTDHDSDSLSGRLPHPNHFVLATTGFPPAPELILVTPGLSIIQFDCDNVCLNWNSVILEHCCYDRRQIKLLLLVLLVTFSFCSCCPQQSAAAAASAASVNWACSSWKLMFGSDVCNKLSLRNSSI